MQDKSTSILLVLVLIFSLMACGGGGSDDGVSNSVGGGDGGSDDIASNPTVPNGLNASGVTQTQITLSWKASTDDSMVVSYRISGGVPTSVTTISTSYTFTNLTSDTQYCFSVDALDDEGNFSGASSALCVTTEALPDQPWITVREGITDPLTQLVWTGARFVAAAKSFSPPTSILSSLDGVDWNISPSSGFAFDGVEALVYTGNEFVGMTYGFSSAAVYTSPDGIAWSMLLGVDPGPGSDFTWSPELNLFVMVGEQGFIATSPDAFNWTTVNEVNDPSPVTTLDLYGVRFLGGTLFAVGEHGTILTSAGGSAWTQVNFDDTNLYLSDIAFNGETGTGALYVAVGYNGAYTSPNGTTWTKQPGGPGGYNDRIVWGGAPANCFVTVGLDNHLFTSPDGVTWTRRFLSKSPLYAQGTLYDVGWNGALFAVTGDEGTILTSSNGADWTIRASGHTLNGVRYIGSEFVAVGHNGRMVISSDGLSWDYQYTGDDSYYIEDIASNGSSTWILPGQTYMLRSEDDMQSWTADWWGATSTDNSALWDGSRFLWVGESSILGWDGVSYDAQDDIDWKWSHFGSGDYYEDLYWDGSIYVAVGFGGVILTSDTAVLADTAAIATSWTDRTDPAVTTADLYAVTKGLGRHVAVGQGGTVITSDDGGANWTTQISGFDSALYDVAWTGTDFIAVGYSGAILTSGDAVTWLMYNHGSGNLYSVEAGIGEVIVVGDSGQIIRRNSP